MSEVRNAFAQCTEVQKNVYIALKKTQTSMRIRKKLIVASQ